MPAITELATPSEVVHYYRHAQTSGRMDSFLAGLLTVFSVSEMIGPLAGWPTISGLCFKWMGLEDEPVQIWQMLLVLLVQLIIMGFAAHAWWRTCWPRWLAARNKNSKSVVAPESHLKETILGFYTGLIVTVLVTIQVAVWLHGPLTGTFTLKVAEGIVIALSAAAAVIAIGVTPKEHFGVVHPDGRVFEHIPIAPVRAEMTLDQTNFKKSILLRSNQQNLELWDRRNVIELHTADHLLINLGVFEAKIESAVEVTSANAFRATGRFSVGIHTPSNVEPTTLNYPGVDVLVRNLYDKTDLLGVLKSRLNIVMNQYAGAFDAEAKSLVEEFRIKMARYNAFASGETAKGFHAFSPLNGTLTGEMQLLQKRERAVQVLDELEDFRARWAGARLLHEQAKVNLPVLFNEQLTEWFKSLVPQDGTRNESVATVERLMTWARVDFQVESFEIVGAAMNAETLISSAMDATQAELDRIQERLFEDKRAREAEIRMLIDTMIGKIDPNTLTTPKGAIFFELMKIRSMTNISHTMDEIMRMIDELRPANVPFPFLPFSQSRAPGSPPPPPSSSSPSPSPSFSGPRSERTGSDDAEVRRIVREQLRASPLPVVESPEGRKLIDLFVARHRGDSPEKILQASRGLILQLSNMSFTSEEPT